MAITSSCYSHEELQAYHSGYLTPTEQAQVLSHVARCASCRALLEEIRATMPTRITRPGAAPTPASEVALGEDADNPPLDPASLLLPPQGPDELGRLASFRVLRVIGEGGMGVVFEAEDTDLRRRLALKVMLPSLATDPSFRQRFLREAQAMAAVDHDYIVSVYQVGVTRGPDGRDLTYLAMPYLYGETLEERLKRRGRLPVGEALRIARQTAEGLAAAHARGLIHRDIKPANVFLEGRRGRVKILDFGLARLGEGRSALSGAGQFIGTPHFMAPEQAAGDAVDARADLFSLGSLLYYMLSGKRPFDGPSAMAVLTALAVKNPPPLAPLAPEAPPELIALVERLQQKKPDDRPGSAQEVVEALEALERLPALAAAAPAAAPPAAATPPTPPPIPTPTPPPLPTGRPWPVPAGAAASFHYSRTLLIGAAAGLAALVAAAVAILHFVR